MRILTFAMVVACGACSGSSDLGVQRTDSVGIEMVVSPALDQPLGWRFEIVTTIASDDPAGAGVFNPNPYSVFSDSAGNIYALDNAGHRVIVFDENGHLLRTMGRQGGGPGEMKFPLAAMVAPDGTVGVFDASKRRLMRFGPDGAVLEEQALGPGFSGGQIRMGRRGAIYTYRGLAALDTFRVTGLRRTFRDSTAVIVERRNSSSRNITLASCGMGFSNMPPLFDPTIRWSAHGERIAVAMEAPYEIRIFENDREVRRIRRNLSPRAANAELARQEMPEGFRIRTDNGTRVCDVDEVVEQRGYLPEIPLIGNLAIAPSGELWVQRTAALNAVQPIDVFDAEGAYLGTLPESAPFPSAFLPDDRIVAIANDELDVASIVIYRITRR